MAAAGGRLWMIVSPQVCVHHHSACACCLSMHVVAGKCRPLIAAPCRFGSMLHSRF